MPMKRHLYPSNWSSISKHIRDRDGNCCQFCGVANGSIAISARNKLYRIVLTCAHLDHDTTNNSDNNLASLCQPCHLRHDATQHVENARKTREDKKRAVMKLPTLAVIVVDLNRIHLRALSRIEVTESEGARFAKLVFLGPIEAQEYEVDPVADLTDQIKQLHAFNCFGVLRVHEQKGERPGVNIITHFGTNEERQEWRRGIDTELSTVKTPGAK